MSAMRFVRSDKAASLQRLADMLGAVEAIRAYTSGVDWENFSRDVMRQDAVIRRLEIISEAQKGISPEIKARHREIDWRAVHNAGNVYRHQYPDVDIRFIWDDATGAYMDDLESMLRAELPLAGDAGEDGESCR